LKLVKLIPSIGVPSYPENSGFILQQNYPNPFNPSTTITVDMEKSGTVRLSVHNLVGEAVTVLHDGFLAAGAHRFRLRADGLPSGVYTYRLEMEGTSVTRRMLLLR
jgi:hypothetical protein